MLYFTRTDRGQNADVPSESILTQRKRPILGIPFDLMDYEGVLTMVEGWRRDNERHYVTMTPPYSVLMCRRDPDLRQATSRAALTLPDGVGIILAARLLRYPHRGRVTGPTLMLRLSDWGRTRRLRHFYYGGAPGVADQLADQLTERYPGLEVAGTCCPPFRELTAAEDAQITQQICEAKPDIVWVGLGSPKQEKWMAEHAEKINAVLIGVGAAFDFHSGKVRWAPPWMRSMGIEWAYRLATEPRRMWRRNVNSFVFLAKVLHQRLHNAGWRHAATVVHE